MRSMVAISSSRTALGSRYSGMPYRSMPPTSAWPRISSRRGPSVSGSKRQKAHRAAADDGYALAGVSSIQEGTLVAVKVLISGKALQRGNGYGSSTRPLLQLSSQGCGHTLPRAAGSGMLSLISSRAFSNSPLAMRPTYPWQSVPAGQASTHGGLQSPYGWKAKVLGWSFWTRLPVPCWSHTIPRSDLVAQALQSLGLPSTSTRTGRRHRRCSFFRRSRGSGMKMSFSRATSRMVWPATPSTSLPFIFSLYFFMFFPPPLVLFYGGKFAGVQTFAALYHFSLSMTWWFLRCR